jgi:hypothetical protein
MSLPSVAPVLAPGLLVDAQRFLALLDHLLQHDKQIGVAERLLALPAIGDIPVLDRCIDGTQGRSAALVASLQRRLVALADRLEHG